MIILKVIDESLKRQVIEYVDKEQNGFRKGKGTRNATFVLRTIMERAIGNQKVLYFCFVDFEKAFDTVGHGLLMDTLRKYGVNEADVRILAQLYWQQREVAGALGWDTLTSQERA